MSYDTTLFADIDKCADISICEHTCVNSNGSFNCIYNDGYSPVDGGRTCMDINECTANLNRCQKVCVNVDGSFRCECDYAWVSKIIVWSKTMK